MFVFAHYWGVDEVGVFLVPAVLAILLLRWVEKRARKRVEDEDGESAMAKEPVDAE